MHIHDTSPRKHFTAGELRFYKDIPIFVKHVDSRKHKLRIFDGYGIQETTFKRLQGYKTGFVVIIEDESTLLVSELKDWRESGRVMELNPKDGQQRFLSTAGKFMQSFTNKLEALKYIKWLNGVEQGLLNPTNRTDNSVVA